MDSKEFIKNAVKTESRVDTLNIDQLVLEDALKIFILSSELLDGIKKQAFYNNSKKLDDKALHHLSQLMSVTQSLGRNLEEVKSGVRPPVSPEDINTRVAHGVIGISTEAGELAECFLNSLESGDPIDAVNLTEELFDSDWYKAVISDEYDIDWGEWWAKIIAKLKARFGDKFSEEAANNRDTTTERKILEN